MKILIIQQKMIGDVLTSSILFEVLRKEYPTAQMHYLIYKHTLAVVQNNPNIDRFILSTEEDRKPAKFYPILKKIKKEKYDIVVDVYSKIGTAILSTFSGAKISISYDKWYTRRFYTHTINRASKSETAAGLAIENRLQLLSPLLRNVPRQVKPKIYLSKSEIERANITLEAAKISSEELLLMISVLGSSIEKTYPHKYLAILLDQIVEETGAQLLFNYIPKQLEDAQNVYNNCKPITRKNIHLNVFGNNLREFIALTSLCNALIGNEGGAVNMAKALNVPTFSIFSPAINKEDWSLFESEDNVSVHLQDYRPELFNNTTPKEVKKRSATFYSEFQPDLISEKLREFLRLIQEQKNTNQENF